VPHVEHPDAPEMIIRPRKGWIGIDWRELWNYRELMYFLVWARREGAI
jgi:lipopolysaccharide transport system permease protein